MWNKYFVHAGTLRAAAEAASRAREPWIQNGGREACDASTTPWPDGEAAGRGAANDRAASSTAGSNPTGSHEAAGGPEESPGSSTTCQSGGIRKWKCAHRFSFHPEDSWAGRLVLHFDDLSELLQSSVCVVFPCTSWEFLVCSQNAAEHEDIFKFFQCFKLSFVIFAAQAKQKTDEASRSEAKFLKMKAWSKSRIRQLEEELKRSQVRVSSCPSRMDKAFCAFVLCLWQWSQIHCQCSKRGKKPQWKTAMAWPSQNKKSCQSEVRLYWIKMSRYQVSGLYNSVLVKHTWNIKK